MIKENNDGVFEKQTEEIMDHAVDLMERNLENFKGESSKETLQEVDRDQYRWFVFGGLPHAVKKKDLDIFLDVIAVKLKVANLIYAPIRSRRSLILQANSQDDLDHMLEKLQPFNFFKGYGERAMIGNEGTDEYVQELMMAEDGGKTFSSFTLFQYQSLSVTGIRNSVW